MKAKQSQGWKAWLMFCKADQVRFSKKKKKKESEHKNKLLTTKQPKRHWRTFTTIKPKPRRLPAASGRGQWLWISDQESQYLRLQLPRFPPSLRSHGTWPCWTDASRAEKRKPTQTKHLQRHVGTGHLYSPALFSLGSDPSGTSYQLLMTSFATHRPHNETGGGWGYQAAVIIKFKGIIIIIS